jgi:ABC-type dipeptide/oligopeptide/nickel transport system ATPase subunit
MTDIQSTPDPIVPLRFDPETFYRRTTVISGPSATGKSTIAFDIAHCLQGYITQTIVFSGTESENHAYEKSGITPPQLIHPKPTPNIITKIMQRQSWLADIYNKINDPVALCKIIDKIPKLSDREMYYLNNTNAAKLKALREVQDTKFGADRENDKTQIEEKFKEVLGKIYKYVIWNHRDHLLSSSTLTKREQHIVRNIKFNPSLLIIMDDVTSELIELKKCKEFSELFFAGRWKYITAIVITHTATILPVPIRENAFIFVFTAEAAMEYHFITNKTNSFAKDVKTGAKAAMKHMQAVALGHTRIAYIRHEEKFYTVTASKHPRFTLCDPAIVEFCKKLNADGKNNMDRSNPFFRYGPDL